MQPAALVDIFRPHCHKPVLSVSQVRAKLHDHVRKLVKIRPRSEVLHSFVFEHTDLLRREAMHLDYFERLTVKFEREGEFFELAQAFVKADEAPHVFSTLMPLILLQQLVVAIHLIHVQVTVVAVEDLPLAIIPHVMR